MMTEALAVHQQGLAEACKQLKTELEAAGHEPQRLINYADLVEKAVVLRVDALYRAFIRRQLKELKKHPESYTPTKFTNQEAGCGQEVFGRRHQQSLVPMDIKGDYDLLLGSVVIKLSGTEAVYGLTLEVEDNSPCRHGHSCKDCTTIIVAV